MPGKVVERLVADLITDFVESKGLFHVCQFGGRRQRSAVDAVACLIGEIEHAWGKGKLGACQFMDINEPFDWIKRRRSGLNKIHRFLKSCLSSRSAMEATFDSPTRSERPATVQTGLYICKLEGTIGMAWRLKTRLASII